MSRRKRDSTLDDLLELIAMLPWWVGVLLAVVSYVVLNGVASQAVVVSARPADVGVMFTQSLWKSLATFGQYLVPFICLLGVIISALRRRKRRGLVAEALNSEATEALDRMSWREFEMLVGEGFRIQGYRVAETGGGGADGGVDLVLSKPGRNGSEKFLVQCKQWRAYRVGVDVVRELYGVMAAKGAAGGFVVTSGRFTEAAIKFAEGRNVTLVDGPKLQVLLEKAQSSASRAAAGGQNPSIAQPMQAPTCPLCSKRLMKRTAKRGANAGSEFWGCTGYPACRGTRPV